MKTFVFACLVLMLATFASAQIPPAGQWELRWTLVRCGTPVMPGCAADLVTVNGWEKLLWVDALNVPTYLTADCVASTNLTLWACRAPLPALQSGPHTLQLSSKNQAGESLRWPDPGLMFDWQTQAVPLPGSGLTVVPPGTPFP